MNLRTYSILFAGSAIAIAFTFSPTLSQGDAIAEPNEPGLELTIIDSQTRQPIPARVRLRDRTGKDYVPAGAIEITIGRDNWFAANKAVTLSLPAGPLDLRAERGPEYSPVNETVDIAPKGITQHQVILKRWINLREYGYASGEDHVHIHPDVLGAMLAVEDLDFGTSLSWWNGPRFKVTGSEAVHILSFGTNQAPATLYDAEVERPWGAVYLIGLKRPVTLAADPGRPNLSFVQTAHAQGALVCYQGGWSREALLDALLGYVDVVNICDNNFQRHKYQPRSNYSNLLNVEGFPEYPDTPEGMMQMSMQTYYRLLNCGLHIAAGAGSAAGAKTTPVGYNRSYVRLGQSATIANFLESWREGRNFVTDGPMIFLAVNGSSFPGDTIVFSKHGGEIHATATAFSDQPLRSLEIIVNGVVVGQANLPFAKRKAKLSVNIRVKAGCWIAARATAEDRLLSDKEMASYDNEGANGLPEKPSRLLFGHTSPVYVTVGGAGACVSTSVQEAIQMLNGFERFASATAAEQYQGQIHDALRLAHGKLKSLRPNQESGGDSWQIFR